MKALRHFLFEASFRTLKYTYTIYSRKTNSGDDLMSNMLEQAIADAAALREQAIKNAEQSVIEKYSRQIKEAVDQMLEVEEASNLDRANETIQEAEDELLQEEEVAASPAPAGEAQQVEPPPAWDSRYDDMMTNFTALVDDLPEDNNGMIELDLGEFELGKDEAAAADGAPEEDTGDLGDLGGEEPTEGGGDGLDDLLGDLGSDTGEDLNLQEVIDILEGTKDEKEDLEEAIEYDYDAPNDALGGVWRHNRSREEFNSDAAEVTYGDEEESSEEDQVDEELMGRVNDLHETVENLTQKNQELESVLSKVEVYLEQTLLSNAKLLYQNRTLGDASLNERQKSKIVEAIANAESPKEAKQLHETLKATVGSTPNSKGPQSLSESVNRRSNLSSMLNSRQNINESKTVENSFMEKMQKLAGIKK